MSSTAFIVSCTAIKKVSTFETGIGAPSTNLRTGPMIMETIPPTLRQTTISATMSTRMTAISVITTTYTRLPEQEMAQGTSGGTIQNNNVGVHKNENAGVHQHSSMHSPQSGNNDPQNDPTIKTENMIDVTGNENESKNED